jgi:hypothetical protein
MVFNHKIAAIKHVRENLYVKHTIPSPTHGTETVVYYERPPLLDAKNLVEDILKIDSNTEYTSNLIAQLRRELAAENDRYHLLRTKIQHLLDSSYDSDSTPNT